MTSSRSGAHRRITAIVSVLPSYPLRLVQLVALWSYSVAQPAFTMMGSNPEFMVVRGSTGLDLILFALLLVVVPPLAALSLEWLVARVSEGAADLFHLALMVLVLLPLGLLASKQLDPTALVALAVAASVAVAIVAAYARWRLVRTFLTVSIALPLIGLGIFVLETPSVVEDARGAPVTPQRTAPVVVLLFDELPTSSLLTTSGEIDPIRYPNFARLAREATWYSRATTVHEYTTSAVPAIMTGRIPDDGTLPIVEHHPENLFTLLGESYRMEVQEPLTYLCPKRYCPRDRGSLTGRLEALYRDVAVALAHRMLPPSLTRDIPTIGDRWGGFTGERLLVARDFRRVLGAINHRDYAIEAQFARFLRGFSRGEPANTLHFVHLDVPHPPWRYLPSGQRYGNVERSNPLLDGWNEWDDYPWLVRQTYQRHLLQVGYTDRLVGRLLRRLEATGLYDEALLVVLADHGASFNSWGTRRTVDGDNLADIARIPLFVKLPGQRAGRVDTRAVRTVDVLPTVADVLGLEPPAELDGRSLLGAFIPPTTVAVRRQDGTVIEASIAATDRAQARTVRRKVELFGERGDSLFVVGTNTQLLGSAVGDARSVRDARISLDDGEAYRQVDTSSPFVPILVTGTVEGVDLEPEVELAVAINGTIAALTRTFMAHGELRFSALPPPRAFRNGFNRIELLAIGGTRTRPELISLGSNDTPN